MGGEGMAQGVWRQRLVDPGHPGLMLDAVPEGLAGHLLSAQAGEQHITGATAEQLVTGIAHVAFNPHDGLLPHRHQTLLAALAHHPQNALAQIDLFQGQADQLGYPQAAGIQHFEHGPITLADGLTQVGGGEQCLNVRFRQGFRQRPAQLRHIDLQGRVDGNQLFSQQIAVEATRTGEKTRR